MNGLPEISSNSPRLLVVLGLLALILMALLVACDAGGSTERPDRERSTRPPASAPVQPTTPTAPSTTEPAAEPTSEPAVGITPEAAPTPAPEPVAEPTPDSPPTEDTASATPEHVASVPLGSEVVSAGGYHNCGVKRDGSVECWGNNEYGQAMPPAGEFATISAGFYHTCGVRRVGALSCWGHNQYWHGEVNPPPGKFASVSAGWSHTCGVKADGSAECWGADNYGQSTTPAGEFASVRAGGTHTCGVRVVGSVECWGDDSYGQSTPPTGEFAYVSAGWSHTCGMKVDGTAECWGGNHHSDITDNVYWAGQWVEEFASFSAGNHHNCGVKLDGSVACWGWNDDGQATPPGGRFISVSAGEFHACGTKADGSVECWGSNQYGQATPPAGVFATSVARQPIVAPGPAPVGSVATDRDALVAFHDATNGHAWNVEMSDGEEWEVDNEDSDIADWHGVTVDEETGRVTRLELPGVNLNNDSGGLRGHDQLAMLGGLTALTHLDLSGNDLGGALPSELDQLTELTVLNLSGNAFRGDIDRRDPDDLSIRGIEWENLENLVELDLSNNKRCGGLLGCRHGLSGSVIWFGHLPNLEILNLSGNELNSGAQFLLEHDFPMDNERAGETVQINLSDNPWNLEPEEYRDYWNEFEAEVTRGFINITATILEQKYPELGVQDRASLLKYLRGKIEGEARSGINSRAVLHIGQKGKYARYASLLVKGTAMAGSASTGIGWVMVTVEVAGILKSILDKGVELLQAGPGATIQELSDRVLGTYYSCLLDNNVHLFPKEAEEACSNPNQ